MLRDALLALPVSLQSHMQSHAHMEAANLKNTVMCVVFTLLCHCTRCTVGLVQVLSWLVIHWVFAMRKTGLQWPSLTWCTVCSWRSVAATTLIVDALVSRICRL